MTATTPAPSPATAKPAADPLKGGERRHLTVMFCDLVGSTALSERLDAEDLSRLIQTYSDETTRVIREHGGYVARYMGDGVLSYFGYPKAFEDNAARSVRAAQAVIDIAREIEVPAGVLLQSRVGIASGETVTGHTAEADAGVETLAIGRTPNLAARLQGLAEPNEIIISESTYRRLRGEWRCESLGNQELKGFDSPEPAWRVLAQGTPELSSDAGLPTLVRRNEEFDLLQHRFARAREGHGQVVHLVGEAGIGKSTLALNFLGNTNTRIIRLACRASREGRAFAPVIDYFSNLPGESIEQHSGNLREALKLNLPRNLTRNESTIELIEDLVLSRTANDDVISAADRRALLLTAMLNWVEGLSDEEALIVFVEDLHWADASTLDWLDNVTRIAESRRLMLLVTSRPEFRSPWEPSAHIHTLQLGRLPSDATADIITQVADGAPVPAAVVRLIVERTDGVPLFVEEMTREVLQSNALRLNNGVWELVGSISDIGVPDSLQDLLMARLDRSPDTREVAQFASVLGRDFETLMLSRVRNSRPEDVDAVLGNLELDNLVRRRNVGADAWYFRHALVRDAAYKSLLKTRRMELHARCAEVIEALDPDCAERDPERLAWHLGHANRSERACELWQKAAELARSNWANAEAADYFERALAENARLPATDARDEHELELLLSLGEAHRYAKGSSAPETLYAFQRAAMLSERIGARNALLPSLYGLFIANFTEARLAEAASISERLDTVAEELGTSLARIAASQAKGMHAFATGDFGKARSALEAAMDASTTGEAPKGIQFPVTTESYLCWTLHLLGESDAAVKLLDTALKRTQDGPGYDLALLLGNGCYLHQMREDPRQIEQLADRLQALAAERHLPAWEAVAGFFQAYASCTLAPSIEELERLQESLKAWDVDEIETPYFKCLVAERLLAAGQIGASRNMAEDAIKLMDRTGEVWYRPEALSLLERMQHQD